MAMAPVGIGTLTSPRTRSSPITGFSTARSGLASIRHGHSTADSMAAGITAAATGITVVVVAACRPRGARFAVAPTGALSEAAVFVVALAAAVFMVVVLEAEADSTAVVEADIVERVVI